MEEKEILMLSLIASLSGICMLMLKLCFKSKCSTIDLCCGLMKIKRQVQLETELEQPNETKITKSPNIIPQQQPQVELDEIHV